MNRTILGTVPFICTAALADTQDVSFEEIYRRTVEAINWGPAAQVMDDSVVATRRASGNAACSRGSDDMISMPTALDPGRNPSATVNLIDSRFLC